ncbi:MAG: FAD-binding oxidoreductase [Actinomycetota bacterium]
MIARGDEGYDDARAIWNGAIDRRPAAVARCVGVSDVIAAVRFAREGGLGVSVRGGAHSIAGLALVDDGLVIDLSLMRGVRTDPLNRTVRVQGGALLGDVDHDAQLHGLAVPSGVVTHTGVGGLTLGGGIGWLMRKHGLSVDNMFSADVVTADGALVRADEDEHADLFWAIRGGGGNFGVVTSFGFDAVPIGPTVLAGPIYWPMEDGPEVLRFYRDLITDSPLEYGSIVNLRRAPAVAFLPTELHGRHVVGIANCWIGDLDEGERFLEPLRRFGSPLIDLVTRKPWLAHQSMFDVTVPHGWHYYWKSTELPPLEDDLIDVIVSNSLKITSPLSYTVIFHLGGAVATVPEDATAYSHRGAAHNININGVWQPGDPGAEDHTQWTRRFLDELAPFQSGVYVNFLMEEGHDRVRAAYGPEKYERLVDVKTKYDPENFFRINQNISPSRSATKDAH